MRRVLLIIFLGVIILFGVASAVCRVRIDRALNRSINQINQSPRLAYEQMRSSLTRNRWLSYGYDKTALRVFVNSLVNNAKYHLSPRAVAQSRDSFRIVRQSMLMMSQIEADSGIDLSDNKTAIIRAALETSNQILSDGTLDSWNEMVDFFHYLETNMLIPRAIAADCRRWNEQVRSMPVRQLALRQESNSALNLMTSALNRLGLSVHGLGEGQLALAIPNESSIVPLGEADRDIVRAIESLDGLLIHYDDGSNGMTWFYELRGILAYNHGAIMLTHVIDQGPMARQFGTGFIASFMIRPEERSVPPAGTMYRNFLNLTILVFNGSRFGRGANDYFNLIPNPPDRIKACQALAAWNSGTCLDRQERDPSVFRERAERLASQITDPRIQETLQSMRSSNRPLLIVEFPEPPEDVPASVR